jgi:hypothetical protein
MPRQGPLARRTRWSLHNHFWRYSHLLSRRSNPASPKPIGNVIPEFLLIRAILLNFQCITENIIPEFEIRRASLMASSTLIYRKRVHWFELQRHRNRREVGRMSTESFKTEDPLASSARTLLGLKSLDILLCIFLLLSLLKIVNEATLEIRFSACRRGARHPI